MLVTEEEAKKRWCPFARVASFDVHDIGGAAGASVNRSDMSASPGFAPCIASECMAWRYVEPPGPRPPDAPERDDRGYCGLSGSPEK